MVWEEKGYEKSTTLEHLNNRIGLVLLGLKDMKIWLREVESYLNFETRLDVRAHLENRMLIIEKRMDSLEGRLDRVEENLRLTMEKLDDALKEE